MDDIQKRQAGIAAILFVPLFAWFVTARLVYGFTPQTVREVLPLLIRNTFHLLPLWGALLLGELLAIAGIAAAINAGKRPFKGAAFSKFFRGTEVVTADELARKTRESKKSKSRLQVCRCQPKLKIPTSLLAGRPGPGNRPFSKK